MDRLPPAPCKDTLKYPLLKFRLLDAENKLFELKIPPHEYMVSAHGDHCTLAFMRIPVPRKYGPAMILGQVFMRNHFTVFDRGDGSDGDAAIGFARARRSADRDQVLLELEKNNVGDREQRI